MKKHLYIAILLAMSLFNINLVSAFSNKTNLMPLPEKVSIWKGIISITHGLDCSELGTTREVVELIINNDETTTLNDHFSSLNHIAYHGLSDDELSHYFSYDFWDGKEELPIVRVSLYQYNSDYMFIRSYSYYSQYGIDGESLCFKSFENQGLKKMRNVAR